MPGCRCSFFSSLMLVSLRDRLVRSRTQLTNAIRGHAAEFGVIGRRGLDKIDLLLALIATDESIPALARAINSLVDITDRKKSEEAALRLAAIVESHRPQSATMLP